ncbi:MAG TPA: 50S ribosomal protein L17 [bacterium]|nr:50S ribosomal protein L17 [bacterium]
MRHQTHHNRLGVQPAHRRAMIRNMVTSLLKHERIKTTKSRAKEVRRYAEKMITTAKKETLASKRNVLGFVREREVVNKLFKTLIYRYAERKGGYTRVLKLGYRPGDGAEMVFLELVDRPVEEKIVEATTEKSEKGESAPAAESGKKAEKKKKQKEASASA